MKEKIIDVLEKHYYGRNFIESRCADDLLELIKESKKTKVVFTEKVATQIIGGLVVLALCLSLYIWVAAKTVKVNYVPKVINLSNTDSIYKEIEVLKLKSDTIIINNEKQINNYNHASTTDKVELFAKRVNR
jgi:hypothetical protein